MGRKSSAKKNAGAPPDEPTRSSSKMTVLIVVAVAALAAVVFLRQGSDPETAASAAQAVTEPPPQQLQPHKQETLPPLDIAAENTPRPPDVIRAAYTFAAEHPEVLSFVPCFCGCEAAGHKGNHDCFVRSRAANGDVIDWEEHGVECAVCIDVATRSRQLLASGASVQEIRAAIEREFVPSAQTMTPTPKPPAAHSH